MARRPRTAVVAAAMAMAMAVAVAVVLPLAAAQGGPPPPRRQPPGADPDTGTLPPPPPNTAPPGEGDPGDLNVFVGGFFPQEEEPPVDSVDYTGYFHNLAFPTWGFVDDEFMRQADFDYADGVYTPNGEDRPNPRVLSEALFNERSGMPSVRGRTAMLTWFGQQLVEEVMDGQRPGCPPEFHNIPIPRCDPLYDPECAGGKEMPFRRARYHLETGRGPALPRNQLNEITPWLDGNVIYGPGKAWTDAIRSFEGGELATDDTEIYPPKNGVGLPYANPHVPVDDFFRDARRFHRVGNPRGFENPALAALHILWHREHNLQARRLAAQHGNWTDERVFNRARQWTIALYQKVVFDEWVEAFTGQPLRPYEKFRSVHPGITHSFQVAAMRFGHTLVPPGMWLRGPDESATGGSQCPFDVDGNFPGHAERDTNTPGTLRTCNTYGNSVGVLDHIGMEPILRGAASQLTEREDHHVTEDLRGFVFGPKEWTRMDLMAINIQRGREHGVPPFNEVRAAYGLRRYTRFDEITSNATLRANLEELYDSIDDVDLWVGGLLEGGTDGPGETFVRIIHDQFERIRDGDRWYYANPRNGLFSQDDVRAINATKFSDILRRNGVSPVQPNVFFHLGTPEEPCPQPYQLDGDNRDHLNECSPPEFFDWYSTSEHHILGTCLVIAGWMILWAFIAWRQVHVAKAAKKKEQMKKKAESTATTPRSAVYDVGVNVAANLARDDVVRSITRRSTFHIATQDKAKVQAFVQDALRVVRSNTNPSAASEIQTQHDPITTASLASIFRVSQTSHIVSLLLAGVHSSTSNPSLVTFQEFCTMLTALLTPDPEAKVQFYFNMMDKNHDGTVEFEEFRQLLKSLRTKAVSGSSRPLATFAHRQLSIRHGTAPTVGTGNRSSPVVAPATDADFDSAGTGTGTGTGMGGPGAGAGAGAGARRGGEGASRTMRHGGWVSEEDVDEEFEQVVRDQFHSIDTNHDGHITRQEFQDHILRGDMLDPMIASVGFGAVWKPNLRPAVSSSRRRQGPTTANSPSNRAPAPEVVHHDGQPKLTARSSPSDGSVSTFQAYLYENRVWFSFLALYIGANILVVAERVYTYSVERELRGLRQIAGYGISITRGAASGIMLNMVLLLLPLCKRIIAILRTGWVGTVLPLNHMPEFHIIAGATAGFFMVVHTIGHLFNFFHVSTQPNFDIQCLFREIYLYSSEIPSFVGFWLTQTATGSTGFLLVVVFIPFFIYCVSWVRKVKLRVFKRIHLIGTVLGFALTFIHGGAALVQSPGFPHYCAIPFFFLAIEFLLRVQNSFYKFTILRVEALASGVTMVELRKPMHFTYHAGQYIKLTLSPLGMFASRTFTLTSAPHEEVLRCHIASTGPGTWTDALYKQASDPNSELGRIGRKAAPAATAATGAAAPSADARPQPTKPTTQELLSEAAFHSDAYAQVSGPFGASFTHWQSFDAIVLCGGGIGVTPFASILTELLNQFWIEKMEKRRFPRLQRVYFLWTSRTQHQLEWFSDLLSNLEAHDHDGVLETHIFLTAPQDAFDLRLMATRALKEQLDSRARQIDYLPDSRQLFAPIHFGRPDYAQIFKQVQTLHKGRSIGVFTCGPGPMAAAVGKACRKVSAENISTPLFHSTENFY